MQWQLQLLQQPSLAEVLVSLQQTGLTEVRTARGAVAAGIAASKSGSGAGVTAANQADG